LARGFERSAAAGGRFGFGRWSLCGGRAFRCGRLSFIGSERNAAR
jgi:hypothetical protein